MTGNRAAALRVGLTGGIASGKSTVAGLFGEQGADVIDTDEIARALVRPGSPALARLVERFGRPMAGGVQPDVGVQPLGCEGETLQAEAWTPTDQPSDLVLLAMGKFGGAELNYHSDLDLIFLYEAEGETAARSRRGGASTSNQHFFSELGQRIIKATTHLGPYGRLYELDARLRPTGRGESAR